MTEDRHNEFLKHFLEAQRALRGFVLGATGDATAADDLIQTTASILWEKWEQFDQSRPFVPWAMGVARLEILKWRQARMQDKTVLSTEAVEMLAQAAEEHAEEADQRFHLLGGCLQRLDDSSFAVLEMKYQHGMKIQQIAAYLQKSVKAIEMTLVRARRKVRECIEYKIVSAARGNQHE
ncbi:MAG: sigma-70 family RNA polymerase sigma factor [Planctomycetes bacterium]|nr:sigma-70 family RNA polymerase sigma factor [Planctomycetota bacterium]